MIYSISGILQAKKTSFVVVKGGALGYKVFVSAGTLERLPTLGSDVELFTYQNIKEDAQDLFGFISEKELDLFEALITVNGVGPKSAMNVMGVADIDQLIGAINEGRSDLLGRAAGVGKKIAERIALELKGKLTFADTSVLTGQIEADIDLEETLVNLGLARATARAAIAGIDPEIKDFNGRLKAALKKREN